MGIEDRKMGGESRREEREREGGGRKERVWRMREREEKASEFRPKWT